MCDKLKKYFDSLAARRQPTQILSPKLSIPDANEWMDYAARRGYLVEKIIPCQGNSKYDLFGVLILWKWNSFESARK